MLLCSFKHSAVHPYCLLVDNICNVVYCYLVMVLFNVSVFLGLSEGNATVAASFMHGHPQVIRPRLDGRIVGGVDTQIETVPYQASLLRGGSHVCGGAIIGWNVVITAAHCTDGSIPSTLSVRLGSSIRNSGGKVYNVATIHQHPNYNSITIDSDISVLILAAEISFGPGINSIALPPLNGPVPAGADALVSGWGSMVEGGASASQLQSVVVPIVSNADCAASYEPAGSITNTMVCAGFTEGGKDACQGDSGGPLVVDDVLVGLVSWGYGCARPGYPGVYTSVPALRDFIKQAANI